MGLYLKRVAATYLQEITNCPILHKFSHGVYKFKKVNTENQSRSVWAFFGSGAGRLVTRKGYCVGRRPRVT